MIGLLDDASAEALHRNLTLGVTRQPVSLDTAFKGAIAGDDPKGILKALALLGQRSRFRRPVGADVAIEPPTAVDPRPLTGAPS